MTAPYSSPEILIAGGGIGGLAAALALARRGIATVVLERRATFSSDGAGIQIGPNGTRILAGLGVAERLAPHVTAPEALRIRDAATGRGLATFPLGPWIAARHGAPYWVAHRRDLHAALVAAAGESPLITVRTGTAVTSAYEKEGPRVAVAAGGETLHADALIAADGVWSELRSRAFGGAAPRFTGKTALRAVVPMQRAPQALGANEVFVWLGPRVHVVHYPVCAGRELAIVAVFDGEDSGEGWSAPCERGWVEARVANFPSPLRDLLHAAEGWRRWPLQALPRWPCMARGRMALLGDAAHPVLPFLAQGGVMALEDAAVLAHELAASAHDVPKALAAYAAARTRRARRVASASRMNGQIYHLGGALAAARNLALAYGRPEQFMSRYDWLYGWRPLGM
jgi:salicylate hydroxylase